MAGLTELGRAAFRAARYAGIPARCFVLYWLANNRHDLARGVAWLQDAALAHSRWLNLQTRVHGKVPRDGVIVANHVSYLDVVALSSVTRCAFVAKKEVARWPFFERFARLGATIFVGRERRAAVSELAEPLRAQLIAGIPIVLFPEGTSSDGTRVLPFRPSLLEPAVQLGCPVTPCGIRYILPGGSVAHEVAYWGDMTLAPHLLNLMRKRAVMAELHFGTPRVASTDRKRLARELREEVQYLAGTKPMHTPLYR